MERKSQRTHKKATEAKTKIQLMLLGVTPTHKILVFLQLNNENYEKEMKKQFHLQYYQKELNTLRA